MAGPLAVPVLLFGGTLALVGGIAYASWVGNKKRTEAMRVTAQTMGFSFEETCGPEALGPFPLMDHGRSRQGRNVMRGILAGRAATICDYRYTSGSGKNSHTINQTVVIFSDRITGLPDFDLSPENVFHKIGQLFGYQDIDFDSNEEFSKQYLLRGKDEEAIRRLFNSEVLMLLGAQPGWSVQAAGGQLLVHRSLKTSPPAEVPWFAAEALRIAGVIPRQRV